MGHCHSRNHAAACARAAFKDVGKGWYNLGETNWHTYEFSKLRRLLLLVRLIMEDTLRMVGEDSMVKFNAFLKVRGPQEGGGHGESTQ